MNLSVEEIRTAMELTRAEMARLEGLILELPPEDNMQWLALATRLVSRTGYLTRLEFYLMEAEQQEAARQVFVGGRELTADSTDGADKKKS